MSKVVGIDLGTTNSLVAFVKDGVPVVIRDPDGNALVPSIVSSDDKTIFVGREAQRRLLTDANRTVYSVKRFMGKGLDDIRDEARLFPFRITGETGCTTLGAVPSTSRFFAWRRACFRCSRPMATLTWAATTSICY